MEKYVLHKTIVHKNRHAVGDNHGTHLTGRVTPTFHGETEVLTQQEVDSKYPKLNGITKGGATLEPFVDEKCRGIVIHLDNEPERHLCRYCKEQNKNVQMKMFFIAALLGGCLSTAGSKDESGVECTNYNPCDSHLESCKMGNSK